MYALVLRGGKVLARPTSHDDTDTVVPLVNDIAYFIVTIDYYDYLNVRTVQTSTGEPPDGWRWLSLIELQTEVGDAIGTVLGEAILCGS